MAARPFILTLFILLLIPLVGCQAPRQGTPPWEPLPEFDRTAEERAVYAALIDAPEDVRIVVVDTTAPITLFARDPDHYYEYVQENSSDISPELWEDFVTIGAQQIPFPPDLPDTYQRISQEELATIFNNTENQKPWETFQATYGAFAYADYSRVGFSPDHRRALVYTGFHCGDLCGSGTLIVMQKEGGEWTRLGQVMTWIS